MHPCMLNFVESTLNAKAAFKDVPTSTNLKKLKGEDDDVCTTSTYKTEFRICTLRLKITRDNRDYRLQRL